MQHIWKIFVCLIAFVSASCGDGDAEIGYEGSGDAEKSDDGIVSIAYLKSIYAGHNTLIDRELLIKGQIVSTDRDGAFYKNIVIQDATGGIVLLADIENYYRKYFVGTEVTLACNSLTISAYSGLIQLGYGSGYLSKSILTTSLTVTESQMIRPKPIELDIEEIDAKYISCFVCINNVQFEEIGVAWCDSGAETGTNRHLINRDGKRLIVRTSPYVVFANTLLPRGSGFVEGILGVFDGEYQLQVGTDTSLVMDGGRFEIIK